MFWAKDRLNQIDKTLRIELRRKDVEIERLQQELKDTRSWGEKWRVKAKFLRRARRDLLREKCPE
jgi:hypothetical protein